MRVAVFCGSSAGRVRHVEVAAEVGRTLAVRGAGIVYGGGRIGTMGAVADGALSVRGSVIGVIPEHMVEWEIAHDGLTELHVVGSMHERKALMADLADAFVALPGGAGTMEELCEIWTWAQLELHTKPIGLLNVDGFYDHLLALVDHMVSEGFLKVPHREMLLVDDDIDRLLDRLLRYRPPAYTWVEEGPLENVVC
ncbi:TIGR00730 family Rossman fold protein [Lentzea sp. NEAU-D13]|uniref:Cytokinin riboside 5'-monophosphate phosphoribohydrolase n=1 Tax=Lentzea alba TaxID=2714351 RepID=A0A7C9VPR7_9PSEU|nr:TIGR00730 family Rossman fold protein [Lentzea alba]NGY60853.1 TIGR00730 family Rossman fold protein [Lentzea alba]